MASEGKVVLSYHDVLLRESDIALLHPGRWLNDLVISFWFEYLHREVFRDYKDQICFVAPEMVQLVRAVASNNISAEEFSVMLSPTEWMSKRVVFFPINDSSIDATAVGGNHWSLLVWTVDASGFEHYDSIENSSNRIHALEVVNTLSQLIPTLQEKKNKITRGVCQRQENSFDCGIHVLANCDAICQKLFLKDTRQIREIATNEVIKKYRERILGVISSLRK